MRKLTVYEALREKLGREPSHTELTIDCRRIIHGEEVGAELKVLDTQCNALFRKLDALKAEGKDPSDEYMATLLQLQKLTRERLTI